MRYKSERIEMEWDELLHRAPPGLIAPVVLLADCYLRMNAGTEAMVTCIFRTWDEQMSIIRKTGVAPYRSVHEFWRGVDLSVQRLTPEVVGDLVAHLNERFLYGGRFSVAAYHGGGTAPHIHLQAPPEARARAWRGAY